MKPDLGQSSRSETGPGCKAEVDRLLKLLSGIRSDIGRNLNWMHRDLQIIMSRTEISSDHPVLTFPKPSTFLVVIISPDDIVDTHGHGRAARPTRPNHPLAAAAENVTSKRNLERILD